MNVRQTHIQRSTATKSKLVEAATASLVERGYGATTSVEICRRAGVTRGAFNHHYASLGDLYGDVLDDLYARFSSGSDDPRATLQSTLEQALSVYALPEFKAVLELWLACRNDENLGAGLFAKVAACATRFEPSAYPHLAERFEKHPAGEAVYWLIFETIIGLALARATSPMGEGPAHEAVVIEQLLTMARDQDAVMCAKENHNNALSSQPGPEANRR